MTTRVATGSRARVFHGTAAHTSGGLTKTDLKRNKWGRVVSHAKSAAAKRKPSKAFKAWHDSVVAVRGKFGIVHKGTAEYKKVRAIYNKKMGKR